ncbi:MAG: hypothetical protein ACO3EE_03650 [Flavobacteriales bacterium]
MTQVGGTSLIEFFYQLIKDEELLASSTKKIVYFEQSIVHYPACDRLAFEVNLNELDAPIDFHINLKTLFFRQKFLAELEAKENIDKVKWLPIIQLLKLWNDSTSQLFKLIPGVFLEFDFNKKNQLSLPSFFAKLDAKNCSREEISLLSKTIITTLKGNDFYTHVKSLLNRCIYETPQGAYLGYLGIMLSREERVLRLNVYNLKHDEVIPFLQKLGWKGDAKNVLHLFTHLMQFCDSIIVSFDVFNGNILPKIGLESFIELEADDDYRWKLLLDDLHSKNLCDTKKRDAVFQWNKEWFPINTEWHSDLKIASLHHSFNELVYIKQLLSHVKITIEDQKKTSAKIYVGLGQTPYFIGNTAVTINNNTLEKALNAGLNFIISKQNQLGLWLDYYLPAGYSDEWVTAYVANLLKEFFDNDATKKSIESAHATLLNKWRENGGLGYNASVPCDSDSTAWFLHLHNLLTKNEDKSAMLNLYRNVDKGLGTYMKNDPAIKAYTQQNFDANFSGWEKSHDCVSSAAACFDEQSLKYIIHKIHHNICLQSYWWKSDFYTLFWAYFALLKNRREEEIDVKYFLEKMNLADTIINSFDKAYYIALCALLKTKNEWSEQFYVDLLNTQRNDGSWKSSALLLVPMPKDAAKNNSQNQWEMYDVNHIFTTITVLMSLQLYHKI